jgi:hypothetical protein
MLLAQPVCRQGYEHVRPMVSSSTPPPTPHAPRPVQCAAVSRLRSAPGSVGGRQPPRPGQLPPIRVHQPAQGLSDICGACSISPQESPSVLCCELTAVRCPFFSRALSLRACPALPFVVAVVPALVRSVSSALCLPDTRVFFLLSLLFTATVTCTLIQLFCCFRRWTQCSQRRPSPTSRPGRTKPPIEFLRGMKTTASSCLFGGCMSFGELSRRQWPSCNRHPLPVHRRRHGVAMQKNVAPCDPGIWRRCRRR